MRFIKFWFFWVLVIGVSTGGVVEVALADRLIMPEMVLIPAGEYLMGTEEGEGRSDEHPKHKVYLDAFYFDRFEVTGADFEDYLSYNPNQHPTITGWWDRKVRPDMKKRPVFGLSWKRCANYCEWRGRKYLRSRRKSQKKKNKFKQF